MLGRNRIQAVSPSLKAAQASSKSPLQNFDIKEIEVAMKIGDHIFSFAAPSITQLPNRAL
jgi:hypothetical protein